MNENTSTDNGKIFRLMENVGLDEDTKICQYLNLDYLLALLKTGKYYVNRKQVFADKRESSRPLKLIFSEFTIPGGKLSPAQEERSKKRQESVHQFNKVSSYLLTSCWTEQNSENVLMWERGGERHKACIKSTVGKFVSAISETELTIWCGKIMYDPIFSALMSDDILWYKQSYFSDEREIRFYFSKDLDQITPDEDHLLNHKKFSVDTSTLIQEIILSPYINDSTYEELKETIEDKYKIHTTKSKIEIS